MRVETWRELAYLALGLALSVVVFGLELAVLIRALEGLTTAALVDAVPDRASLWAGLFDLRENLFGRALDDLRALAVA